MPAAVMVKLVVPVAQIVAFDGAVIIVTGVLTVNTAAELFTDGVHVPLIVHR